MSDENTIIINLDNIEPVQFQWNESDMSAGITAQELSTTYPSAYTSTSIQGSTINNPSAGTITITGATGSSGYSFSSPFEYEDMENRLSKLEKIIAEEELIRRTHPAVQTAYDHYKLLLVLAGKISPEELT